MGELSLSSRTTSFVGSSRKQSDPLTFNLILVVFVVSFGTWFSLGYNVVALNSTQTVIVDWIRMVGCGRLESSTPQNHSSPSQNHSSPSQLDLWCHPINAFHFTGQDLIELLGANTELNSLWAVTATCLSIGKLFSAVTSRPIIKRFGLKTSILLNTVIVAVGTVISCLAQLLDSYEMLITGRIIVGFVVGSSCVLTPMFVAEVSPVTRRGALGTLPVVMFALGTITATVLGLPSILGNSWGWPILLGLHLIPVGLMGMVLPFCPETPRQLLLKTNKRTTDWARNALIWLRNSPNVEEELQNMLQVMEQETEHRQISLLGIFRDPFLRSSLWLASVPFMAMQLSGFSCLSFYSTAIFSDSGLTRVEAIYATLGVWIVCLIMTIVSGGLVDRVGRRLLLLSSHVGVVLSLSFLVLTRALTEQLNYAWTKYGSVAAIFGFIVSHGASLMSVPWILGAELIQQEARVAAMTFFCVVVWLCELAGALLFPIVIPLAREYTFTLFIGFTLFTGSFIGWRMPETKGKTVQEIQQFLRARKAPFQFSQF
ncbi:Solute carrier family 2, facilitated glucose transporter member 1 [Hypsibius exemplaris]|uniref:Solute carrier family 2, facilitated glucose transporter member 1 n=1 Tax=Hypsibius exemplaris TaxID=2072580 RepID=A0A1W0WJK7_HYPEX|nr:Solute carrier family 2, facilitated glucose transporter member 1 [Hypsibius exemplaris]